MLSTAGEGEVLNLLEGVTESEQLDCSGADREQSVEALDRLPDDVAAMRWAAIGQKVSKGDPKPLTGNGVKRPVTGHIVPAIEGVYPGLDALDMLLQRPKGVNGVRLPSRLLTAILLEMYEICGKGDAAKRRDWVAYPSGGLWLRFGKLINTAALTSGWRDKPATTVPDEVIDGELVDDDSGSQSALALINQKLADIEDRSGIQRPAPITIGIGGENLSALCQLAEEKGREARHQVEAAFQKGFHGGGDSQLEKAIVDNMD